MVNIEIRLRSLCLLFSAFVKYETYLKKMLHSAVYNHHGMSYFVNKSLKTQISFEK